MNITRRRFAQLGMGSAFSLGSEWLLTQGLSTHRAKPLPRSAPSGRPFHVRFVDVGHNAGLHAPVIYGGVEQKNYEPMGESRRNLCPDSSHSPELHD